LRDKYPYLNRGEDDVKGPHAEGCKSIIVLRGQTGGEPGRIGPRPVGPTPFRTGSTSPLDEGFLIIFIAPTPKGHSLENRQIEGDTLKGAVSYRKSSNWLGDGLGHALATMVGPAWSSHGGVPEPCLEFIKVILHSTFDSDINNIFLLL
jgi:hypothetical protein